MSRVAKKGITVPKGVEVTINQDEIRVEGKRGALGYKVPGSVSVVLNGTVIVCDVVQELRASWAMAGTARSRIYNMVIGVSEGFEKKLQLVGVGYRAQAGANVLNLTLGFSHPVDYKIPDGISIETPAPTEIKIEGIDKQQVGQVAAEIRNYRPPEPYKGKGVRYWGESIALKESKKK